MNEKIENALVKFLMNTANIDDLETLSDWLKKEENKQIFKSYVRTNYAMDINLNEFKSENAKKQYLRKIREDKGLLFKYRLYRGLKYAAAAIIILGLGHFVYQESFKTSIDTSPVVVGNDISVGKNKATLTLENGSEVELVQGNEYHLQNADSNGEQIVYSSKEQTSNEITYNYLTIPRGGEFLVKLSDGTQVWLNSESKLKFPIRFIDGETREVELVYGEAYFDVSPSTENNGAKFKVVNDAQEIEVLGTEFNIKAYEDEFNIYTTLVEGKVKVNTLTEKQVLVPNQQLKLNITNNLMEVVEVNVKEEIAWVRGRFVFQQKSLKEIAKVLSRWYDVNIEFDSKSLEEVKFNGELSKERDLEGILQLIKNTNYINDYEKRGKQIILK
ncbi:FecR family protein [Arenibacter nanhaiticus]|uniref:FecR family protein n=1 Tax=Arenibacter nanhaiticus TaxID=558155 RepID=A0A1M6N0R5_9FLAO|nr:FecR domain-containing protein [Arenibacter nanhaiticus]SHJ89223.1 FecR family protein [Arenibacter nanhaiticus]